MSIEANFEKFNNNEEMPKIEIIPKTEEERTREFKRPTRGQINFYRGEIERTQNLIEEMKMKGLNTKSLEMKLKNYQELLEKAQEELEGGHA